VNELQWAAQVNIQEIRLTDAFTTEYMATSSDDTIREGIEADGTFLNLEALTVVPGLLWCLRWFFRTRTSKWNEVAYRQLGLHPFSLKLTDL